CLVLPGRVSVLGVVRRRFSYPRGAPRLTAYAQYTTWVRLHRYPGPETSVRIVLEIALLSRSGRLPHRPGAEQRAGADWDDEVQRDGPDYQLAKLSVLSALHRENLIEKFGLQLRRDERDVHQRGH